MWYCGHHLYLALCTVCVRNDFLLLSLFFATLKSNGQKVRVFVCAPLCVSFAYFVLIFQLSTEIDTLSKWISTKQPSFDFDFDFFFDDKWDYFLDIFHDLKRMVVFSSPCIHHCSFKIQLCMVDWYKAIRQNNKVKSNWIYTYTPSEVMLVFLRIKMTQNV